MNFGSKIGEQRQGFPLTSLIDLLFILLIFFMTASMYAQFESELNVQVPVATEGDPIQRKATELMINVTKDGKFVVTQSERTIEEIHEMLHWIASAHKGAHVILRGDRETAWQSMVKVLDACKEANVWNVSFAVLKTEEAAE